VTDKIKQTFQNAIDKLPYVVIGLGLLLRLNVYIQGRALEVDEANIARNIFESGYLQLLQPLRYEQYAPYGFLWAIKTITIAGGYGEYVLRLFPLLCGAASLIALHKLLKHFGSSASVLYPLFLFATGYIYLYYATEVKQYASDVLVTTLLVLIALSTNIDRTSKKRFLIVWGLVGIVAMLFSMPSVFILAGVGCYYIVKVITTKQYNRLLLLCAVVLMWLVVFLAIYYISLKEGIGSGFLQWYHERYFPELLPKTNEEWQRNKDIFSGLTNQLTGDTTLAIVLNVFLVLIGLFTLLRKHLARTMLLMVPIIAVILAAAMHHFTLIPRVVLFITPILFVLMAVGMQTLFQIRYKVVAIVISVACVVSAINFQELQYLYKPLLFEEFDDALTLIQRNGFDGKQVHITTMLEPAYIYYTQMHPDNKQWKSLKYAGIIQWTTNHDSLVQTFQQDVVVYSWYPDDLLDKELTTYRKYCEVTTIDGAYGMKLFLCKRKQ